MTEIVKRYDAAPTPPGPPSALPALAMRGVTTEILRHLPQAPAGVRTGTLTADAAQSGSVQVGTGSPYAGMRLATGQRHSAGNAVVTTFSSGDPQQAVGIMVGGYIAP